MLQVDTYPRDGIRFVYNHSITVNVIKREQSKDVLIINLVENLSISINSWKGNKLIVFIVNERFNEKQM